MPSLFYWLSFCQLFLQFFYLPVRKSSLSFHVFSFNCLYPLLSLCFVYYTGLAFLSLFVGFVFILCLSLPREMHLSVTWFFWHHHRFIFIFLFFFLSDCIIHYVILRSYLSYTFPLVSISCYSCLSPVSFSSSEPSVAWCTISSSLSLSPSLLVSEVLTVILSFLLCLSFIQGTLILLVSWLLFSIRTFVDGTVMAITIFTDGIWCPLN